jgi:hypothetical protein
MLIGNGFPPCLVKSRVLKVIEDKNYCKLILAGQCSEISNQLLKEIAKFKNPISKITG